MPVIETTRTERSLPTMQVQSFSFHGKGRRAKPKKGDYRPTFYTSINGVFKGKVKVISLARGGFSVHNLGTREVPAYLASDAEVVVWYADGTVDTVTIQDFWDYFSQK